MFFSLLRAPFKCALKGKTREHRIGSQAPGHRKDGKARKSLLHSINPFYFVFSYADLRGFGRSDGDFYKVMDLSRRALGACEERQLLGLPQIHTNDSQ